MPETYITFGIHGARVMIENKKIQHYAMQVDQDKKEVTCWIASEAGKAFSVEWLKLDVKHITACDLYLDGHHAESIMRRSRESQPVIFEDGTVSESSCAPFIFSPLVVTDDDDYLDTPTSIGEIKLVIYHTTMPKRKKGKKKQETIKPALPHIQKVHERKKKGIDHRVSYGDEIAKPRQKQIYSLKVVKELVTFIFRYRPLEILRANEIVPRKPEPLEPQERTLDTPPPSETSSGKGEQPKVKREAESGSEADDSDEDMIKEEKALLAKLEKIRKARHLKDSKRPEKKLKTEDKPFFTPGEVIDLT